MRQSKNDFRRKWDKDEYEKLAQKRLRRETVKRCFSATEIIKWIWNQNWERQSSSQRPHHRLRWEGGCLLDNDRSSTMSNVSGYCAVSVDIIMHLLSLRSEKPGNVHVKEKKAKAYRKERQKKISTLKMMMKWLL
ncbi:zinc finger matrin-type protein 2-like isoform X2 [Carassius auratus]|uniref:Zinc finger matrin-type protein 2-like isoform X2 n=1 Tax=Carassius auratus TaxID=7957 RepID=A0A6P6IVA8_CARAU|nr:zinc finger matrin-type protein 2-like isoform X2 [Carassius auratus]